MEINTVKRHFDSYSKTRDWSGLYSLPATSLNWSFLIRKQRVLELINESGGKILDIGCGPGVMISELLDKHYEYFGIDISNEMIEEAKIKFINPALTSKVHLRVADATYMDYPDGYFDGAIGMGLLEYFSIPQKLTEEINRVLKPGGFLIVTIPKKYQLDRFMVLLLTSLRIILAPLHRRFKNINLRPIKRIYFSASELVQI